MTFNAKNERITIRPEIGDEAPAGTASTSGIPCDGHSLGEQAARGARKNIKKGGHVTRPRIPTTTEESAANTALILETIGGAQPTKMSPF